MKKALEDALRPVLNSMGIVGKRGPVHPSVLPMMLGVVCLSMLIFVVFVKMYHAVRYRRCMWCDAPVDTHES